MTWTDARVEELRTLAASPQKPSASVLAGELGVSRNAVIGKCRRAGIQLQGRAAGAARARKTRVAAKSASASKPIPFAPPAPRPKPKPLRNKLLTLAELADDSCRYVVSDPPYLFCGEAQMQMGEDEPRSSYCAKHDRICHQPSQRRAAA